ncbi:MAG TPA: hypothetical protein VMU26_19110 [Candidatus Polarisedimenticolia bacterium]|nr:hypothetical protein [Candidatus Polarisedimenticolia bacterium]
MNENVVREMLHELFTSLEALETQNSAITQFLKDKGITNEEELAPYLERAGDASNIRWLAARVRMDHLLSSATKTTEKETRKDLPKVTENSLEANAGSDRSDAKENKKDPESTEQAAAKSRAQSEEGGGTAEKNQNQEGQENRAVNKNAA